MDVPKHVGPLIDEDDPRAIYQMYIPFFLQCYVDYSENAQISYTFIE